MYYVDYLQIRSNSVISYAIDVDRQWSGRPIQSELTANLIKQSTEGLTYSGELRPGTKKRLTKAVEFLIMTAKKRRIDNTVIGKKHNFKLGFITLTLADPPPAYLLEYVLEPYTDINGNDRERKKYLFPEERKKYFHQAYKNMLAPTLKWMRQTQKAAAYVWKAELQERGQIHWHITCDTFIDCNKLLIKWNELQRQHGYQKKFFTTNGYYSTAGVEVRAVKSEHLTARYLQKEIEKGFQNVDSLGTKVWDCSLNLKGNPYYTVENYGFSYSDLMAMKAQRDIFVHIKDRCCIIELLGKTGCFFLTNPQIREYNEYMNRVKYERRAPKVKSVVAVVEVEPEVSVPTMYEPIILKHNIIKQRTVFDLHTDVRVNIKLRPGWFSSS